jgi:hypothetical protein
MQKKKVSVKPHKRQLGKKTVKVKGYKKIVHTKKVKMNARNPFTIDTRPVDTSIIQDYSNEVPAWVSREDKLIHINTRALRELHKSPMEEARTSGRNKILSKYSDVIEKDPYFYDKLVATHEGVHLKRGDTDKLFVSNKDERMAEGYALSKNLTGGNVKDAMKLLDNYPNREAFGLYTLPTYSKDLGLKVGGTGKDSIDEKGINLMNRKVSRHIDDAIKEKLETSKGPRIKTTDPMWVKPGRLTWVDSRKKSTRKDYLKGGLADKRNYSKFNKKQLSMGTKVEMEHTNKKKLAQEIAGDHLAEHPRYYTALKKMEKELETKNRRK